MSFRITLIRDRGADHEPESFTLETAHRAGVPAVVRSLTFAVLGEEKSQQLADAAHVTMEPRCTGCRFTINHGLKLEIQRK